MPEKEQNIVAQQSRFERIFGEGTFNVSLSIFLLVVLLVNAVAVSMMFYPDFDGAMNFQVAKNLVEGKGYVTTFQGVETIQSGPTLIIPVAMFFQWFGITKFTCQATNLIYFFLAVFLLLVITRKYFNLPLSFLLVVLAGVPALYTYSFLGFGEIIAVCFTLLGLYLFPGIFEKGILFCFGVGLVFGLAGVTKTLSLVSLFVLLPVMFVLARFLGNRSSRKDFIKKWAVLSVGLLVVPFSFEIYKYFSFGSEQYWSEAGKILGSIRARQGLGGIQSGGIIHQLIQNFFSGLDYLSHGFSIPEPLLVIVFCVVCFVGIRKILETENFKARCFLAAGLIYFVFGLAWWDLLTGQHWWRRLFLFYVVNLPLFALVLQDVWNNIIMLIKFREKREQYKFIGLGVVFLIMVVLLGSNGYSNLTAGIDRSVIDPHKMDPQVDSVVAKVIQLPEQSVFLVDLWWQAPEISLYSGRGKDFFDFRTTSKVLSAFREHRSVYFLLTLHEKLYDSVGYKHLYEVLQHDIVFSTTDYAYASINSENYIRLVSGLIPGDEICSFVQEQYEKDLAKHHYDQWKHLIDFSTPEVSPQFCTGWFPPEPGDQGGKFRWMWKSATCFFPRPLKSENKFIVSVYPLLDLLPGQRQSLQVMINDHVVIQRELNRNRETITFEIPVNDSLDIYQDINRVTLVVDNTIPPSQNDLRELGLIVSKLGFVE